MAFTKITQQELNSRGATTLPNQPTIPAQQLKQEFDAPAKEIVAPKVNNLIDELEATSAAASIGAVAPTGRSGSTVKEVLDDISEDLSTVEGSSHSHSNKSLLDSYDQTNANLSDAVTKKHEHSNKSVLDKFSESGGKPLYDGQTIGEGDMKKSDYDSDSTVKNAGGIKAYVDARVSAAYIPAGTKTVAELLPALLIAENNNKVYNITDSGLTTEYFLEGAGKPIYPGDNVGIAYVSPNTYKFDLLRGIVDLTPYAKTADLGTAAYKDSTNAVEAASTALVESGAVYYEINEVKQDLNDTDLAVGALQTSVTSLGKYKAEADSIAPVELDATGASQAYAVDDQFYLIDVLLTATSPIAQNDAIVVYPTANYNCKTSDSVTEQIGAIKDSLGTASTKNSTSVVTDSTDLVESGAVKDIVGWGNKNLIDPKNMGHGVRDNSTGQITSQANTASSTTEPIKVKSGNTYVVSLNSVQTVDVRVFYYASDKSFISTELVNPFTVPSNAEYVAFQNGSNYGLDNWQMELGDTATTYEPYHASVEDTIPQVVSDAVGWDVGNLLDNTLSKTENGLTVTALPDGSAIINGTYTGSTGWFVISSTFQVKANKTYWMSVGDYPTNKINAVGFNGYGQQNPIHPTADFTTNLRININNGVTFDNLHLYPKIYYPSVDEQKCDNSVIGNVEDRATASQAYAVGEHFQRGGKFCTAKAAIAYGATFTLNTNYVEGTIASIIGKFKNTKRTMDVDVLQRWQEAPIGISYFADSNDPTNHPSDNQWNGYVIFKWSADYSIIISFGNTIKFAQSRNLSTDTSITWV